MNPKTFHELSFVFLTVLILLAAGITVAQSEDIPWQDPEKADIDPVLQSSQDLQASNIGPQDVIVRMEDFESSSINERKEQSSVHQGPIINMAEANPSVEVVDTFWITNAIHLKVDRNFPLENIAGIEGVEKLHHNIEFSALDTGEEFESASESATYGLNHINTTETWNEFGTQGDNIKVSVLDTGVDASHPDISMSEDETENWEDFIYDNPTPIDHEDHGTHVSGTVVGGDTSGEWIGVAPNATLMHGAVLDETGGGNFADIISGMQWSVDNGADILSMSLGADGYYETMIEPVRNAEDEGVIVIAAIMNEGEGTSGSPANVYDSFSVGATDHFYEVTSYSSGELIDTEDAWGDSAESDWPSEYIVPDVVAPGHYIQSAVPEGEAGCSSHPCYDTKPGTSMAAPHVSGGAALMQSATQERLTPREIKKSFLETAWKPDGWDESEAQASIGENDSRYGKGIIDVYAATEYAIQEFDQEYEIRDLAINESEVNITDSFKVSGEIENFRSNSIEAELGLKFNNSLEDEKNISLEENETSSFEFTSSISSEDLYNVTVNDLPAGMIDVLMPPPDFNIAADLEDIEIVEGESTVVSGEVDNQGGDGVADLTLFSNNFEINDTSLNLGFESSKAYSFENTFNSSGDYELKVNNTHAGNLTVLEESNLDITNLALNSTEPFFEEETVEIAVTGENTGDIDNDLTFELRIDGELHDSEERFIEAGEQETIYFEHTPMDRGNYTYSSGGLEEELEVLKEGSVELMNSSLESAEIVEGENMTYSLELHNPGDVEASSVLEFVEDVVVYESKSVSVDPNSYKIVNSSKEMSDPGTFDISVNASLPREVNVLEQARLNQTGLFLEEDEFVENENLSAFSTVENIGEVEGNFTIPFNITGEEESNNTVNVILSPDEETNTSFSRGMNVSGDYNVQSLNESIDFTVLKDADIQVQNASLNSSNIFTGNIIEANVSVENLGEVSGEDSLNITLDQQKNVDTGSIGPGEQANVTERLRPINSGNYTFAVNGTDYSNLDVKRPKVNITESSFNVSELGEIEISLTLNNTEPGYVNETVEASINESLESSDMFSLTPNEEKNVSLTVEKDDPGFYVLNLNQTGIGNFSLSEYTEFSDLTPLDDETFEEDSMIEISGALNSVGEPNLTIEAGDQVFESAQESGNTTFSFENVFDPGNYEWSALAEFNNSSFESSTRAFEVEEDKDDDDSGQDSSTGEESGAPLPSEEEVLEPSVEENTDSIKLEAPEGSHDLQFNDSNLPIRSISFEASEAGSLNFSSADINHSGSMQAVFEAETSFEGDFTLETELSKQWIEENSFEQNQTSFYRFDEGWADLNPTTHEDQNYMIFEATLEQFSIFGVGTEQSCYSMDRIDAVVDNSCESYGTVCGAPEGAELVDSCSSHEREQSIDRRISEAREDDGSDSEQITQAEEAAQRGDFNEAEEILDRAQTDSRILELNMSTPRIGYLVIPIGLALLVLAVLVLRPRYRKKRLISQLNSLTEDLEQKARQGEDIEKYRNMVARANEALVEENYAEAEKIISDAKNIR